MASEKPTDEGREKAISPAEIERSLDGALSDAASELKKALSPVGATMAFEPVAPALRRFGLALFDAVAAAAAGHFSSELAYTSFLETEASPRIIEAILPGDLPKVASVLNESEICFDDQLLYVVPKYPLVLELPTDPDTPAATVTDWEDFQEMQRTPAPAVLHRVEMPHGLWEKSAPKGLEFVLRIHVSKARCVLEETFLVRVPHWAVRWSAQEPQASAEPTTPTEVKLGIAPSAPPVGLTSASEPADPVEFVKTSEPAQMQYATPEERAGVPAAILEEQTRETTGSLQTSHPSHCHAEEPRVLNPQPTGNARALDVQLAQAEKLAADEKQRRQFRLVTLYDCYLHQLKMLKAELGKVPQNPTERQTLRKRVPWLEVWEAMNAEEIDQLEKIKKKEFTPNRWALSLVRAREHLPSLSKRSIVNYRKALRKARLAG